MIKTKLSVAIATLGTMAATGVAAQNAVPGPAVEEVIVTGSRIARDPLSSTGPITIVDSEAISRSGVGTVDELLRELPSMGTQGTNANDNNGGNGLSFVDLRNLGSARTLVLVNGRRFVSSSSGVSSAVDMNNIPVDMIDRIEVLTDGASAVYGSDAVAGVINVVMKKSYDGVKVSARAGATDDGGGENGELSITFGNEGARGGFVGNITHSQRDEISFNDRDWAGLTSVLSPTGNIATNYGNFAVGEDGSLSDGMASYDIGQFMWLSGAMERTSATFAGDFSITDRVELYGEASYTDKTTNQQLAAQPMYRANGFELDPEQHLPADIQAELESAWQEAYDAWVAAGSNMDDEDNPYPGDTWSHGIGDDGIAGFNNFYSRPVAGGPRDYEQQTETFRGLTGLRGDMANGWSWDIFASYGKNEGENVTRNSYSKSKLDEILNGEAGIDPVFAGGMSEEVINHMRYADREDNEYELINYGASLTGDIEAVQFQGGPLGFATGLEYREESGEFNPSQQTQDGSTFGNQQDATEGEYSVTEAYAEFNLPILSGAAYAEELSADMAVRYSDFDTFGGETTGKLGLVYAPVEDLRFRASASTSFRAPGIYELYSGTAQSYETLTDPCDTTDANEKGQGANCSMVGAGFKQTGTQIATNIGGNQELGPEEAESYTFGMVWTPTFVEDLSITLDYYDIQIEDAITSPDLQLMLDDCFREGIETACASIRRGASDEIVNLEGAKRNIGEISTRGIDLDVTNNYHFNAGQLALRLQATRLLEFDEYNEQTEQTSDWLGYISNTSGMYVKWRGLAGATWYASSDWSLGLDVRYLGNGESPDRAMPSHTYLDLHAGWDVNDSVRVSGGIDNLNDREPTDGSGNSDWNSSYDFKGRYAWAGVSYQF
ncbi:TonB-dependent receptor plug domain-containing protein [Microbulbifer halophilus]|uniref:TonB-dependent receptor plug domain-containing protein n=1 Tax=Microbulbifer halophilus TaxID=453963 RepID=A0ABW5ECA2_9GAMM|nr:TonB-dependent receptor [Microbulbifer halophilus]MCW8125022.1 TonB-dependent receptor [Microbulbifer halophilus]